MFNWEWATQGSRYSLHMEYAHINNNKHAIMLMLIKGFLYVCCESVYLSISAFASCFFYNCSSFFILFYPHRSLSQSQYVSHFRMWVSISFFVLFPFSSFCIFSLTDLFRSTALCVAKYSLGGWPLDRICLSVLSKTLKTSENSFLLPRLEGPDN